MDLVGVDLGKFKGTIPEFDCWDRKFTKTMT